MMSKMRGQRNEAGLTLLEVLAAVMIFAMVMTVLIGTSTSAVHHVGVSSRRLEADLFADNLLSDLEIQIKQGKTPEIEDGEFTSEQFSIRMTRTEIFPDDPGGAAAAAIPLAGIAANAGGDILSLLSAALPEVAGHLMQYDIEVSWLEQNGHQTVTRTTFAFDWQAAQGELAAFAQDASQNGVSGLDGDGTKPPLTATGERVGAAALRRAQENRPPSTSNGHNAGDSQRAARAGRAGQAGQGQ
jgi:hypothetical protein